MFGLKTSLSLFCPLSQDLPTGGGKLVGSHKGVPLREWAATRATGVKLRGETRPDGR